MGHELGVAGPTGDNRDDANYNRESSRKAPNNSFVVVIVVN